MSTENPPLSQLIYDWNRVPGVPPVAYKPVLLDDETLRDGLQSPSVKSPDIEDKKAILHLMAELGIDISAHRNKSVDEYRDVAFDRVITVCDHAARTCPAWLGTGVVAHLGFPDPAAAEGSEEGQLAVFRQVRDGLREKVSAYLHSSETTTIEMKLDGGEHQ